jgi:thiosulfate/3-mercaptopyruvate sulfurtransferase
VERIDRSGGWQTEVQGMETYAHPEVLMTTAELAGHLDDPALAAIEVDEDTTAWERGHIPGAIGLDWTRDLRDGLRRDFIGQVALAELLGSKGVSSEQTIVLYGGNNNWFATYAFWLLRMRGVERLRLLDGGRKKWELEGRPLSDDDPSRQRARFRLGAPRPELRIGRDAVLASVGDGRTRFVDVRSPEEFRGERLTPPHLPNEGAQVPGHIPGARNIPWSRAANEDGTFKSAAELRSLYDEAGIARNGPVVAYCRIGERASHTWFVLDRLLGYPGVSDYDGSWTEYGSLVDVPVERP